jgi:hypothetical protein
MKIDEIKSEKAREEMASKVKLGECILFLGAGIHAPPPEDSSYVYPEEHRPLLGTGLAEKLAAICDYEAMFPDDPCLDLQRVSLCLEITKDRKKLVDCLDEYLTVGKKPSSALVMLARLPFKIFVTTNYDGLLESALRDFGKKPAVFVYNPKPDKPTPDLSVDPKVEEPLLFKMHGTLEHDHRSSIVITDEDYINFIQRMSDQESFHPVPQTVRYRMKQWPTFFVGYSFRDYNLRLIFRTLRWHIDKADFPVSFSVDRDPDPLTLEVWQNEMKFVTFIAQDLWNFVPWLYKEVCGKEYKNE